MKIIVEDYWWEGNDLILQSTDGEIYRISNAHITNIRWEGLEYDCDETSVVHLTKKYEP